MVIGYHIIITAYGFWLPNDPRGSWSDFVGSWELHLLGRATRTHLRHSLANRPHDRAQRLAAKQFLNYPPVRFSGRQALTILHGFADAISTAKYIAHACSILPAHVHLVMARHSRNAERMATHLKSSASLSLIKANLHPLADSKKLNGRIPSVWGRGLWKVYLDSEADMDRAIRYVENNPLKDDKPRQKWSFVKPYRTAN